MIWEKEEPVQVHRKKLRLSAALLVLAMGAAACGGGGGDEGGTEGGGSAAGNEAASGGTFSLYIGQPENPLVPSNTSETEGGQVVDALFTGLVQYDPDTTEQTDGVAESIESEDSQTWTITLKDGWTFHDGTPVTSDSFIQAWNFAANPANAQGGSYFFANIQGYDEVQAAKGTVTELTGLKKVSDTEFTVTLNEPFRQYPLTLGYTAFSPLPASFFADKAAQDAFGKKPIGNGPFQADADFVEGQGITMSRFEDYAGPEKAKADKVEFRVYTDQATAYTDVQAGNLDFSDVPPDAIASYQDEFGDRAIERETSTFTYVGFPTYDKRFADKRVRQAFSMAIDREGISQAIFNGTRTPARSVISPVVDGHREDACQYCEYKPDEAKALLAEAGFNTRQPVDLWFNAGAGHDEWMQAVGNNLRDNLGIQYKLQGGLQFAEYLPKADEKGFTGPFRLGWAMDYPSPQNYLEPLYSSSALPPNGSNTAFYSNPEFDRLVKEGNAAESNEAAIESYHAAEDVLLEDMPIMPMFFTKAQFVHSDKIDNVKVDAFSNVVLEDVTVNQ
jgi:oligopeptide transport system substrate-binding protein